MDNNDLYYKYYNSYSKKISLRDHHFVVEEKKISRMNRIQDLKLYNFMAKIYIQIKYFWYNIFYIIL